MRDEAVGNPLALLELPRALEESVLSGERPIDGGMSLSAAIERAFLRRGEQLSEAGREALLLAAACGEDNFVIIRGVDSRLAGGLYEAQRVGLLKQIADGSTSGTRWCARPFTRVPPRRPAGPRTAR